MTTTITLDWCIQVDINGVSSMAGIVRTVFDKPRCNDL